MNIGRLLLCGILLFALGTALQFAWPLAQVASYHHFADQRPLGPIPNAADVLSNLVILIAAIACLGWVRRPDSRESPKFPGMAVATGGLLLTAFGSAYYHWSPSDATLVWDRMPMTIVFAGILAMLWTSTTGKRVGWAPVLILVAVSLGTIAYWLAFDSLWPYGILQFGGLAAIVGMTVSRRMNSLPGWTMLIVFYVAAKVFETLDWQVWELTHHTIAGHALKHVCSGLAGACLILVANSEVRGAGKMPSRQGAMRS